MLFYQEMNPSSLQPYNAVQAYFCSDIKCEEHETQNWHTYKQHCIITNAGIEITKIFE